MDFVRLIGPLGVAALLVPVLSFAETTQDEIFSTEVVHEVEITLPFGDWYRALEQNRNDETYEPATVSIDGVAVDSVGVRFKGNSSWGHPGRKKPFRLKYSQYREDQDLDGLPSLILNNSFKDPTLLRETLGNELLSLAGRGCRTGFARVSVNGETLGFYTVIETVNGTWVENRLGNSEDGNLWKSGGPNFNNGGDLSWLGANPESYYSDYTLKSNEEENDWSGLVDFIDRLNNTPISALPDSIAPALQVGKWLQHHAVNIATVNLDAYEGSTRNYYLYQRESDGRMLHVPWDMNEVWGRYSEGLSESEMRNMSALWENRRSRPLADRILEVDLYREMYLMYMRNFVHTYWTEDYLHARIDELGDLIRPYVYDDDNKMYSNSDFETGLERDINQGREVIFGLKSFVGERGRVLEDEVDDLLGTQRIFLNELMADNVSTYADDFGEYDDYVEIYNGSNSSVSLSGYGLTDDHLVPDRWVFPSGARISAGERLIVWLDSDTTQGADHASFGLDSDGEELFLFSSSGELVDFLVFDGQEEDAAFGRYSDGGHWIGAIPPTPDDVNSDAFPPVVNSVAIARPFPAVGRDLDVSASIAEGSSDISSVRLIYDVGAGFVNKSMTQDGSTWSASIPGQSAGTQVSYYVRVRDSRGGETTLPAGAPSETFSAAVFVGRSPITINEFMADNEATLADGEGEYDDWIELANVGDFDVDLSGYFLSDDASEPSQWSFPDGTELKAGEYLLVWADSDSGSGLHADFKLGKSGEEIVLYDPTGSALLDSVSFGEQVTDMSEARAADGLGPWASDSSPSPEAHNGVGGLVAVAAPDEDDIVISGSGGSFRLQASVFNRGTSSASAQAWTGAAVEGGGDFEPLQGPLTVSVSGLDYVTAAITQAVSAGTPALIATYEVRVGSLGGAVDSRDGFTVVKAASGPEEGGPARLE